MNYLKSNLGWILVIFIALEPVAIWWGIMPLGARFGSLTAFFTSLGQLTGLVGMALFAESLILSARLKFFDRHLSGLNRVYINHHKIGAVAFILLLFHPLLLTWRYASVSLPSALTFWSLGNNFAVDLGKYSLAAMIVLLVLTFFVKLPYDFWKNTHKFLGLAFFLGGLHSFFVVSDISSSQLLRTYMLSLSILGVIAYVYHTLLGRWLVRRYLYVVDEVKKLGQLVTEVSLSPLHPGAKVTYRPGQFAFLNFSDWPQGVEQHPFSFTSAPGDTSIKFVIKNLGDYTVNIPQLPKGAIAKIEGPFGKFSFTEMTAKNQIWVAGGIGITPFVSMARSLAVKKDFGDYHIDLFYTARQNDEMVLLDELSDIAQAQPNFRLFAHTSADNGRITARMVEEKSGQLTGKDILICGPVPMMRTLKEQFLEMGVSRRRIHSEEFSLQ